MKKRAFLPAALTFLTLGFAFLTMALAGALSSAPLAGSGSRPVPGPGEPTLAEVRAATERFRDVKVALAEGYIRDPGNMCDTADMMGRPHPGRTEALDFADAVPRFFERHLRGVR